MLLSFESTENHILSWQKVYVAAKVSDRGITINTDFLSGIK